MEPKTSTTHASQDGSIGARRLRLILGLVLLIGALGALTVSQPSRGAISGTSHFGVSADAALTQTLQNAPSHVMPIDIIRGLVVSLQANSPASYNMYGAYLQAGAIQRDGFSASVTIQPGPSRLPYDCSALSSTGAPMPPCTTAGDFLRAGARLPVTAASGDAYGVYVPSSQVYSNDTFNSAGPQRFPQNMRRDLAAASQNGPVLYLAATAATAASRQRIESKPLVIAPRSVALGNGWTAPSSSRGGSAFDFSGTWNTDFGTVKLRQVNDYVIGDYADVGVMIGKTTGQCVAGVFTNGGDNGIFRFRASGPQQFQGQWAWHGDPLQGQWNGTRSSQQAQQFHNFSRDGSMTQSIDNQRTVFDGTYSSNFGDVELMSRDLFLVGDYADLGVIAGMWDGDSFVGRFTNGADTGWFDFAFFSKNGTFRSGSWGWVNGGRQGAWTLNKASSQTPTPANMLADVSCP